LPATTKRPSDADHSHIGKITREWRTERPDLDLANFLFQIYVMRLGRMIRISQAFRAFGNRPTDASA